MSSHVVHYKEEEDDGDGQTGSGGSVSQLAYCSMALRPLQLQFGWRFTVSDSFPISSHLNSTRLAVVVAAATAVAANSSGPGETFYAASFT